MGSIIELNDTLQITSEQGFPKELIYEIHVTQPFTAEQFNSQIFTFKKPDIRVYKGFPVRNFLVENKKGKWLYWGLVHILEITHDYVNKQTAGKFTILYINSPSEMHKAFQLIDRRPEFNFFTESQ